MLPWRRTHRRVVVMAPTIRFTKAQLLKRNREALNRCGLTEQELHAKVRGREPLTDSEAQAVEVLREAAYLLS